MKPGDRVRIRSEKGAYEGLLIQRPEIIKGDFHVLKLSSGYNIGLKGKAELVEERKPSAPESSQAKIRKGLPTVSILSTGGTISSRVDYTTGGVSADYTSEDFLRMCPELSEVANLKARKIMSVMSEDMDFSHWEKIGDAVREELDSGSVGVIVTQGTDTMHFSTAALSFIMQGLDKPVIFTAAQRSIDRGSSDAFMNLICSVHAAVSGIPGVMSCMHESTNDDSCILIKGTKLRKMHTSRRDAFRPVNDSPIARIFPDGKKEIIQARESSGKELKIKKGHGKAALITVYPGMDPSVIDFYVGKGYKGIVLAATALGHVPTMHNSLLPNIEKARKKGVFIVISTQTLYGRVHPYVYSNLRRLSIEKECFFAGDMMPEVAYIKLAWALGQQGEIRELMQQNIAGEYNPRSLPSYFLN